MKHYRLLVLSLGLSLSGLARSAEPVFDTHVHLRDGEASLPHPLTSSAYGQGYGHQEPTMYLRSS